MTPVDIPRYVDSQPQLFFWELDETIVFVGCLAGGIAIGGYATLIAIAAGWVAVKSFRRFKNGALDGVLLHLCYWAGVMSLNDHYQDSTQRDFYL